MVQVPPYPLHRGERVDAIELELEAIESDLEEVRAWREHVSAAFETERGSSSPKVNDP